MICSRNVGRWVVGGGSGGDPVSKNRMATVQESDIQSKFTSKFLSSSIASTNIMDTSDLPVTIETTKTTTLGIIKNNIKDSIF